MPLYDYRCPTCDAEFEIFALIDFRNDQTCGKCGSKLILVFKPSPAYKPFNPYFDEGLGVQITGRDHRRRVMRDMQCDFRDHPSPGQTSARKDWANERRKERSK